MAAALTAAGRTSDVYDFDTQDRNPASLGVLSHYDAVLWETGDDIILRAQGQVERDHDEGRAGHRVVGPRLPPARAARRWSAASTRSSPRHRMVPTSTTRSPPPECTTPNVYPCLPVLNDFQQYWLGAYNYIDNGGTIRGRQHYPLKGSPTRTRVEATGREPEPHRVVLDEVELPAAGGVPVVRAELGPGRLGPAGAAPFEPRTGDWHLFSDKADVSYKRLTRTVDLTSATSGQLRFFTSYETELAWDFLFVEAHEVGSDAWTTLPEVNGHTGTDTGSSCPAGWNELHPSSTTTRAQLLATGTTGDWNAATGPRPAPRSGS